MTHPPKGEVKIQDGVREEYINSSLMVHWSSFSQFILVISPIRLSLSLDGNYDGQRTIANLTINIQDLNDDPPAFSSVSFGPNFIC
jgi:hypothetical protein